MVHPTLVSQTKTTTSKPKIVILESSDWHLGHGKTPTENILSGIYRMLPDNNSLYEIDALFIAGDVYDHDLFVHNKDVRLINIIITYILRMAVKYNFIVRVLEGTPGHDWKQSISFIEINENAEIGADVRYVSQVEIEYNEKLNSTILYVPDEWRIECKDTWKDIEECLKRHNLTQVDFVIMHGCFPHQLPGLREGLIEQHNPDNFLRITKHLIFVGHIHLPSKYKKIVSSGSLDRLVHGEEGKKCWTKSYIYDNPELDRVEFIENKGAYPYKTINLTGVEITKAEQMINDYLAIVPCGYIRIISNKDDIGLPLYQRFKNTYKEYGWTFKDAGEKSKLERMNELTYSVNQKLTLPKLTKDNLQHMLLDKIRDTQPHLLEDCRRILCEVMDAT